MMKRKSRKRKKRKRKIKKNKRGGSWSLRKTMKKYKDVLLLTFYVGRIAKIDIINTGARKTIMSNKTTFLNNLINES